VAWLSANLARDAQLDGGFAADLMNADSNSERTPIVFLSRFRVSATFARTLNMHDFRKKSK
jgi:hypothetical protein